MTEITNRADAETYWWGVIFGTLSAKDVMTTAMERRITTFDVVAEHIDEYRGGRLSDALREDLIFWLARVAAKRAPQRRKG